jgi:hypothetical protein
MKIDHISGKAYLHERDRDLNRLHYAGYFCGYIELVDLVTGEHTWQADAMKRDRTDEVVGEGAVLVCCLLLSGINFPGAARYCLRG